MAHYDYLIVGAGFAGSVCAERLTAAGRRVLLVDRRDHVGGNAHDRLDSHGVLIHPYGPHIFHTNSARVFEYLSRFTGWRPYEHRVLAQVDGRLYPLPINRLTVNALYGLDLTLEQLPEFLDQVRTPQPEIRTSEQFLVDSIGTRLCNTFFRGYSLKQWGRDLSELGPEVVRRVPVRLDDDDRYFSDTYQCMPKNGYTALFERMLDHPLLEVQIETDFVSVAGSSALRSASTIWTGPIDEYFGHRYGPLPYRSLRFEHEHLADVDRYQDVAQINFPGDEPFTRCTEFKHLTGQVVHGTSVAREYPSEHGDPLYPVPHPTHRALYRKYEALASCERDVTFVGRLARYRYLDMDQVVYSALAVSHRLLAGRDR